MRTSSSCRYFRDACGTQSLPYVPAPIDWIGVERPGRQRKLKRRGRQRPAEENSSCYSCALKACVCSSCCIMNTALLILLVPGLAVRLANFVDANLMPAVPNPSQLVLNMPPPMASAMTQPSPSPLSEPPASPLPPPPPTWMASPIQQSTSLRSSSLGSPPSPRVIISSAPPPPSPPPPPPQPVPAPPLRSPAPLSTSPSSPPPLSASPSSPLGSPPRLAPVDEINRRYRDGGGGGGVGGRQQDESDGALLRASGVLLHQFDTVDVYEPDGWAAWTAPAWLFSDQNAEWSDRLSATVVNHRLRRAHPRSPLPTYSDALAGVVLAPERVRVLCAYSTDGETQHKRCTPPDTAACLPGCLQPDYHEGVCLPGCSKDGKLTWCTRGKHESADNELILDAHHLTGAMPHAVEAVFFMAADDGERCHSTNRWANSDTSRGRGHKCEEFARRAHASFLQRYQLQARDVPLLQLDVHTDSDTPFRLVEGVASADGAQPIDSPQPGALHNGYGWAVVTGANCWAGHGAEPLQTADDAPLVSSAADVATCKAACLARKGCEAIVLPSAVSTQPPSLQGSAARCYARTRVWLAGCDPDSYWETHLLLAAYVLRPPPPPAPPSLPAALCTLVPWCETLASWVEREPRGKFMQLWGPTAWQLRPVGSHGCWVGLGGARFFEQLLDARSSATQCDRNWNEGAAGGHADRPKFTAPAAALLGFDDSIWTYCSRYAGADPSFQGFSQQELARRCIRSNNNILRIVGGAWGWNMCQNLKWQLCAATGRLPGQDGSKMRFATAPSSLTVDEWLHPTSWPCEGAKPCPPGRFAVGDVFYAELAVYRAICRNAGALLRAAVGESVICDVDPDAVRHLGAQLMAS